jgi:predicted dehydrogenase
LDSTLAHPLAIWATPEQAPLLRALADELGATIVAAASPVRAHGTTLADALGATFAGDLLDLLNTDAKAVLLATACEGYGEALPQAVARAAAEGRRIATLSPLPMPPSDAAELWHTPMQGRVPTDAVRFGPLLRHSPAAQEAAETLVAFGEVRSAMFAGFRDPTMAGQGATGALLVDALDLLVGMLGEAERVEASLNSSTNGPTKPSANLSLGSLTGDLTAHARFDNGSSAAIMLSDRAGGWQRRATLLGEAGRLELGDDGHRWIDPAGKTIDSTERRARSKATDHDRAALDALVGFMSPLLDGRATAPLDTQHLGPMAAAVLLSARTGQAESPSTLRAMV